MTKGRIHAPAVHLSCACRACSVKAATCCTTEPTLTTCVHGEGCILRLEPVLLGCSIAFSIATTAPQSQSRSRKSPRSLPEARRLFHMPSMQHTMPQTSHLGGSGRLLSGLLQLSVRPLPLSTLNNNDTGAWSDEDGLLPLRGCHSCLRNYRAARFAAGRRRSTKQHCIAHLFCHDCVS